MTWGHAVAVLIPCFNEAVAIGQVVDDFRAALPDARIYVFDVALVTFVVCPEEVVHLLS